MPKSRAVPTAIALAATLVAVAALSGCSTSASTSPSASSSSGFTSAQIDLGVSYTNGKAGKADASAKPVKIGFINVNGGVPSFPEASKAESVAASFINDHLGGVDGHPVQIVECDIVSGDADAQKCAQQFANDPDILSVQLGMTVEGTGPIYSTIGTSKNVIGFGPFGPADLTADGVTYFTGAGFASAGGMATYAKDNLKAKTLAVAFDSTDPGASATAQLVVGVADSLGIKAKSIGAANSSEWPTSIVSAGGQSADAVALIMSTPACVAAAQGVQQVGVTAPILAFGFCQDSSVSKALGDFPKWTYSNPYKSPIGVSDPDVKLYDAVMKSYAPTANIGGSAPPIFLGLVTLVGAMNKVGYDKLSVTSIRDQIKSFAGPLFMGPKTVQCGQYASVGAPTVCQMVAYPVIYKGNGVWEDPTKGNGDDSKDVVFKSLQKG